MNSLVWNCRGAGGKNFPTLIRDIMKIYHLDFIAILEPRISGSRANHVVNKIGLDNCVRVEAQGFSGGIWCLWKNSCPSITMISTSDFCIHLKVNSSPSFWNLSIIYASPQPGRRLELWNELREFNNNYPGPWCLAGDFNTVLFD